MVTLNELPDGVPVYVDANIFVYHFTGVSQQATQFLERCEAHELVAYTGHLVVLEVMHRLMLVEARQKGLIAGSNPVRQLSQHPDRVRQLTDYQLHVAKLPQMGVTILDLPPEYITRSAEFRQRYGLLTHDSLVALDLADHGIPWLASANGAFDRLSFVNRASPTDLPAAS